MAYSANDLQRLAAAGELTQKHIDNAEWAARLLGPSLLQKQNQQTVVKNKSVDVINDILNKAPKYTDSLRSRDFQNLKSQAFGLGPLEQFEIQRGTLRDAFGRSMEGQDATLNQAINNAYSQLAMGGGLSGGQRERIAIGGATDNLRAKQGLRQNQTQSLRDIGMAEAAEKLGLQKTVLDAETQENMRKQQMEMDQWKLRAETQAGIQKSETDRAIAASNACFSPNSLVTMADGSVKKIDKIKIGDCVKGGGKVYAVQDAIAPLEIYLYNENVFVTGCHAVFENGEWKRVKDSEYAERRDCLFDRVKNIATVNHSVEIEGTIFADMHETDFYENITSDDSLTFMNGRSEPKPCHSMLTT